MMPIVGILVSKVDTRLLVTFGCLVSASALFVMAGWDLGLDYGHAVRARMLQTFGLAFLFYSDQRVGVRVRAKGKKQYGHGNHQPGAEHGGERGNCDGDDDAGSALAVPSSRLMEHVNNFNAAVSQHAERDTGEVDRGGLDGGARQRASTRNDLRHDPAAGGNAGVYR